MIAKPDFSGIIAQICEKRKATRGKKLSPLFLLPLYYALFTKSYFCRLGMALKASNVVGNPPPDLVNSYGKKN
jgi:hypothetical protein